MRLIDADELLKHEVEADRMGAMLVVGKGYILSAPTIDAVRVAMDTINFVEMLVERVKGQGLLGANHSDDERERDVIAMIEDCYATFEHIKREVADEND